MTTLSGVYEKTYRNYLSQLGSIDPNAVRQRLGAETEKDEVVIPLFGKPYRASPKGITDISGKQPSFDVCVILCKYLLLCPLIQSEEKDWVSFRGLRDSGPLTTYFANEAEGAIAKYFMGKPHELEEAGRALGGYTPDIDARYDVSLRFDVLPKVPLVMLYNDADKDFPAKCSVLFERRAEMYLDAECLSMVGRLLFSRLKKSDAK
ncbi:MAG: DUF3786 domain-containing protein [Desulfobacteraceae bacterium]|nr:DUF3786 domain-containing protein [Desulfobacteraceae bacterium]